MNPAENYPSWSFKTVKSVTDAFKSLNGKVKGQAAKMEGFEGRLLAIENTLKQLPHFASPPDGKPNNNTAPKVGREYPEFRCPDCPQGVKGYKYGKTWGHHFIKDHQQMYPALDGNGYWCCAKFQTVESLAEHRWKYHVETGQE